MEYGIYISKHLNENERISNGIQQTRQVNWSKNKLLYAVRRYFDAHEQVSFILDDNIKRMTDTNKKKHGIESDLEKTIYRFKTDT